jgi:hypothetical protein
MAKGDFSYVNASGDDFTLHNPDNGEYFELVGGAKTARNRTNTRATLCSEQGGDGSHLVCTRARRAVSAAAPSRIS